MSIQQGRATKSARYLSAIAIFAAIATYSIAAEPATEIRRILILNEVGASYPGIAIINGGIQDALNDSSYRLELYSESMDTGLFPDPAEQREFRDFYLRKYQNRKPNVIITVGPSPLKFMQEVHRSAFPGVPIVFCLPQAGAPGAPALDPDFTGVENDVNPAKTLEIALRLRPGTKHVVVVNGGIANFDKQQLVSIKQDLNALTDRLDITYVTALAMPDLLERLKHLPSHTLVLLTTVSLDAAGNRFTARDYGPMVDAANAPVFSMFDVHMNHGEVGGYLSSLREQGKVAGAMALRILKGDKPQNIPRVEGVNAYMFDWAALQRWGLKVSDLPPDSIVLNRHPTPWESYKYYIAGGISLILVQTLLILGLIRQRARRRAAETKLGTTLEAVQESERRFRLIANSAPVMIWMSGPDKLCNYFNQPWLEFTGRRLEAELGHGWSEGVHPEDLKNCMDTYTRAFDLRESFKMEYQLRRHDGEYRWLLDIGAPRLNLDGSLAGYIGSCLDITDYKLAREALAGVGRRLIEAHEQERTWIARELHDDISQRIALLSVKLEEWDQQLPAFEISTHGQIRYLRDILTDVRNDIHALSHRLHSSKLEYLGVVAAAAGFCKELSEQQKVEIDFRHEGIPHNLPKEISLCLFRVLQEALQNAVKHSGMKSFNVELQGTSEAIQLTVSDQGVGFDPQAAIGGRGLGLISMRERLQLVDGKVSIESKHGSGTMIRARVPYIAEKGRAAAGGSASK